MPFSIPDGINKKTLEGRLLEEIQVEKGDIFGHNALWYKFIFIARSAHSTPIGFQRFGEVRQGLQFLDRREKEHTITNCGFIFNQ